MDSSFGARDYNHDYNHHHHDNGGSGFDSFVGERLASAPYPDAPTSRPESGRPASAPPSSRSGSGSNNHPQFTSDLQVMGDSGPSPPRETSAHFGDANIGGDLGPRVSQKWSILGPIHYVNVPSTAPIYDPDQTDTFEPEPSDKKRWLKLLVWLAMLVSLGLFCFGVYNAVMTQTYISLIAFLVLFVIFFAIYLRLQLLSANVQYLRNICRHERTPDYIEQLKKNRPRIIMSITCFHYAAPGGLMAPADGGEDPNRREMIMEGDMKKVETFHLTKEFVFDSWEDQSSSISGLEHFDMIKLKLKTRIGFADMFTKQKFEEEQAKFLEEYKGRDQLYKYKCEFEVPNLRPKSLSVGNPRNMPALLSLEWYMTCTFFLMGWPFNYWMDVKSTKVNYVVQKVVKKEPTQEDILRRVASERRVARKLTNASVTRTASRAISGQVIDATLERRNTSGQNDMTIPMEAMPISHPHPHPHLHQTGSFSEYPYEFSSPRGNFH